MIKIVYQEPEVVVDEIASSAVVCASPCNGGNEDFSYEEWVL